MPVNFQSYRAILNIGLAASGLIGLSDNERGPSLFMCNFAANEKPNAQENPWKIQWALHRIDES